MKIFNSKSILVVVLSLSSSLVITACSSAPGSTEASKELAATGPSILNVQLSPPTVELNRSLQPEKTPEVLADVKDFRSKITSVVLKFKHVPMQIAMENIGGTTWRGVLTQQQLETMAVSGKTINYDASVIARNADGQVVESNTPIIIAIKAPDISQSTG